jgi:hypothetical protein
LCNQRRGPLVSHPAIWTIDQEPSGFTVSTALVAGRPSMSSAHTPYGRRCENARALLPGDERAAQGSDITAAGAP